MSIYGENLPEKYYRLASAAFLCEELPEGFMEWEECDVDLFLLDNAWKPLEYLEASDVWDLVASHATHIHREVNNPNGGLL